MPYSFSAPGSHWGAEAAGSCIWLDPGTEHSATATMPEGVARVRLPEPGDDLLSIYRQLSTLPRISTNPPLPLGVGRGEGDSSPITPHSSLTTLFAILSRAEEYAVQTRDRHGRFQWCHSPLDPTELAASPLVSQYAGALLHQVREAFARAGLPMIRKEAWPRGKGMGACLSHDVDVVRRGKLPRGIAVRDVKAALSSLARGQVAAGARKAAAIARTAAGGTDPYWTFDRISHMEREHGYPSTYYFMAGRLHPEDANYQPSQPRMRALMAGLLDSGCEIGLHGSYTGYQDATSLARQKALLESALGAPVAGHRNHLLRFSVPGSWTAQEAAGFAYDATLGFADREGFRGGHAFPFYPYDPRTGRAMKILEVPLAVMDVTLSKYRRLRGAPAWQAIRETLESTDAAGGLAVLLWHNDTFYDPDYPGSGTLYAMALEWLDGADAHVATVGQVVSWWRARESVDMVPLERQHGLGWEIEIPEEIEGLVLRVTPTAERACPRVSGADCAMRPDGEDWLLEFDRLPACGSIRVVLP